MNTPDTSNLTAQVPINSCELIRFLFTSYTVTADYAFAHNSRCGFCCGKNPEKHGCERFMFEQNTIFTIIAITPAVSNRRGGDYNFTIIANGKEFIIKRSTLGWLIVQKHFMPLEIPLRVISTIC
jgi:hypothetical protein